jgi:GNAT superfamily N-acetyltransferase
VILCYSFYFCCRYYQILKPNFPMDDEVESLDSFKQGLLAEPNDDDAMLLEIVLAVRWEGNQSVIGGGVVYEYYFDSNCGLVSFLVVSRVARGQGLSRILVEMAAQELEVLSVEDGGALAGCNAIFLETNAAQAVTMEQVIE